MSNNFQTRFSSSATSSGNSSCPTFDISPNSRVPNISFLQNIPPDASRNSNQIPVHPNRNLETPSEKIVADSQISPSQNNSSKNSRLFTVENIIHSGESEKELKESDHQVNNSVSEFHDQKSVQQMPNMGQFSPHDLNSFLSQYKQYFQNSNSLSQPPVPFNLANFLNNNHSATNHFHEPQQRQICPMSNLPGSPISPFPGNSINTSPSSMFAALQRQNSFPQNSGGGGLNGQAMNFLQFQNLIQNHLQLQNGKNSLNPRMPTIPPDILPAIQQDILQQLLAQNILCRSQGEPSGSLGGNSPMGNNALFPNIPKELYQLSLICAQENALR